MKRLLCMLLLSVPLLVSAAPMTNDDIIRMVRSGLGDDTVVQAVNAADSAFDTSPDGLVKLRQMGVSDKIIQQMMAKKSVVPAAASPVAPAHARPMTNDDVIRMVKSGLGESTVLQAINAAEPGFDTSPDGLIKLKEGGVSDKVIQQVMARKSGAPAVAAAAAPPPPQTCPECGTVTGIKEVKKSGSASGVGALTGAVVGGGLGYAVGGHDHRTAGTLIGAGGGALAGNMIEKRAKSGKTFKIDVRFDNGTTQTFRYDSHPGWNTGSRVRVVNGQLTTLY